MGKKVTRLFAQFQPEHYDLQLLPDREAMTFRGTVTVRGKKVGPPSQRLTFHQKELKITAATIVKHDKKGDQTIEVSRINNQDSLDEVRLHTDGMVYPGSYTVTMEFEGQITRQMNGIYPCFFTHDGRKKKLIATQFESHHAREAIPCIDEPEAKATFDLTLTTPVGETVIANTPVKKQLTKGKNQITTFETTPRMSVYLLAFVYGEMGYSSGQTKNGIEVRSYATPDNVSLTKYSVGEGIKILEFFEDYFGVPYPLPKLDMAALPDFSVGAMENWGLITFRETAMLTDPESSSIESQQIVSMVIAHEISHQWFGNLVTMLWWDDLWLNESFANMMEYRAVDAVHPEWQIWEQFISHDTASAKRRDSLANVQTIRTAVNHPDEINTLFDPSIVYAKGGSVLYMLMHYIGEAVFRKGLSVYFEKHAYSNTHAEDLWAALSEASKQDVNEFMDGWLTRPGYPLVSVDWTPGSPNLGLKQQRFLSDPAAEVVTDQPWHVPLAATVKLDKLTLDKTDESIALAASSDAALLLNHDGTSYFLPHYTQPAHLRQIVDALGRKQISVIDRLLLLDNYTMLQRGSVSSTTELLELLSAFTKESSEAVWGAMGAAMAEARKLVEGAAVETKLDGLIQELVLDTATTLGWDDDPSDDAQTLRLRGLTLAVAAGAKAPAIIDEGLARFRKFKKPSDLPASTRTTIYFCGARYGTDKDFDKLYNLHETLHNAEEREEIAGGLTATKQPAQIQKLLDLMLTDSVRRQDLLHWYARMLRNRYSRQATWQWLATNWDKLSEAMSTDKNYSYFPRFAGSVFSTADEAAAFKAFFEDKKSITALGHDITLAEQEIASRVAWRQRNEAAVKAWLAKA